MSDSHNLTFAAPDGTELGYVEHFGVDLAVGDEENDFTMGVPLSMADMFAQGSLVYFDGTGWGGIVYGGVESTFGEAPTYTVTGRSWEGIMSERFMLPRGSSHVTVSGDANDCIAEILRLVGLDGFIRAASYRSGIQMPAFTLDRFTSCYQGMRKMLRAAGAKLVLLKEPGAPLVASAAPIIAYRDFDSESRSRYRFSWDVPYNHIVGLGKGEMEGRAQVELFADADGIVSDTQTIIGLMERQYRYEYTTDDEGKLLEDCRKKLESLQKTDEMRLELPDGVALDVGDTVTATSARTGRLLTAEVVKTVVVVDRHRRATITNELGEPQQVMEVA